MTTSNKVVIIDYGMGNLDSISRAMQEVGASVLVSSSPSDLASAERIILPGVGAFSAGMENLSQSGFVPVLCEAVLDKKIPFLGICLGMQLLADEGTEGGLNPGLGFISGRVEILPSYTDERIPHIGWNSVEVVRESPLFTGISSGKDFYFVHSFHLRCQNQEEVIGNTEYAGGFCAAVQKENIFGVQFHPEKSQKVGFQLLRNFLSL